MATTHTEATDEDTSTAEIVLTLTVSGLECITGVLGNGLITALLGAQWASGKRPPVGDHILLLLSCSRLVLQIWMMLESVYSLLLRVTYSRNAVYVLFKVVLMFLNFFNLWLAAWLNVFYCVRIANFTQPWFSVMRRKIGALMPWFLGLSLLVSLGCSFTFASDTFYVYVNTSTPIPAGSSNTTEQPDLSEAHVYFSDTNVANLVLQLLLGVSVPLAMFILSAALLIASLRRHALRMQSRATGSGDPSAEAHVGAIKALSSFLALYILHAAALFLSMSNIFGANGPWSALCKVVVAAYPAGHSVLLILSNPGLRRAWKQLRHQLHLQLKGQPL
ncbi:taste receptor type 2 member 40-like [Talpa occidentalis]|uniref:taste receptor type 2 member 40-like n=1 Tax=Talpa occidentalis TaxID=50954 RepID=UPI00188EE54D|nr:taste receptor type 2 member 40-like [Talpa occidentalis]